MARSSESARPPAAEAPWEGAMPARTQHVWQALPERAPSPADNPWTPAKAELGERLFFDKRLSANGELAARYCRELARLLEAEEESSW